MAKTNNDFRILITAQLDEKASEKTIRDQLQSLQDKLNIKIGIDPKLINQLKKDISRKELDLSVGIDDQSVQIVKSQVKNLQRSISKNTKIELFEFDDSELRQKFDSINEAYKAVQKIFNGQKPRVTQFVTVDDDTEKIKKFTLQVEEADKAIHKLQFALDENGSYFLKSRELVDRQAESIEKLRKEEERLAEQIAKKRESANTKRQQEELKLLENQQKAIQKNIEREQQLREKALEEESKIRLAIAKKNEELERSLELYRKQAEIRVKDLERRYGDKIDRASVDNYLNAVNALSVQTPNVTHQMRLLDLQFKDLSASIKESGSHTKSFGQQLAIAMQRIPIWVLGMTAFYQPLHLMQDAIAQIIEIDTQLTTLERVTGNQTNVNELLEESIRLADQLGNKVSQINEGLIEFARQGFEGDALIKIAEFATLMSNVSDLTVEESASSLTAAINAFSLEAENAIQVVDALNEVDNNFAISTQDLSQVIQKAAGTANTFNVSLEAMIGHATAIGQVTRESGNIIGTSLKSIYSRITTMDESVRLLESVGVAVRNMNGEIRPVEDILKDLAIRFKDLNSEQQQAIGLQLAGRYQLSRFLVLMQQFDEALKAQETAINSNGSAYRENERYLDSYQARLNRLSNAWTEASLAMQDAFLGDGIILFAEGMTSLTKNFSEFIKTVGLLPPVMGAVGAGLLLFNTQMRNATMTNGVLMIKTIKGLVTGFRTLDGALAATTLKTRAFAIASSTASVAVNGLKTAVMATGRFLAGAALPVAGFMALGWAIGKVTEKIVEHNEQQKQLKKEQDQIIDSYINQKTEIDSLLSRFNALNSIKDRTNEQEQEYLDVQNKLGQLMPNLISHIDEYGQTHIKVGDALENELQYAKELVEVYRTDLANAYKERFEEALKAQADAQKEIDRIQNQLNKKGQHGGILGDVSVLSDAQRRNLEFQLRAYQRDVANANEEIRRQVGEMITEILKLNNIKIDNNLSEQIKQFANGLNLDELNADEIAEKAQHFSDTVANLKYQLENARNGMAVQDATKEVKYYAMELGYTEEQAEEFIKTLIEQAKATKEVSNATTEASEDLEELTQKYNDAISNIKSLNGILNELNEGHGLSGDKIGFLLENYPHLLEYLNDEITLREKIAEEIQKENETAKKIIYDRIKDNEKLFNTLLKANEEYFNNLAKMYEFDIKNVKSLAEVKAKIESKLTQELSKKWGEYYDAQANALSEQGKQMLQNGSNQLAPMLIKDITEAKRQMNDVSKKFEELSYSAIDLDFSLEGVSRTTSKSSKQYENAIYVSDKFKQALEKVNFEIEKQQKLKAKFPKYTNDYQKSLKTEIELQKQKKELLEAQSRALEKQISSGKIQKTGVITSSSPTLSSSSSYSGKYADIINKAAQIYGLDPHLIAAVIKAESNFNPNARSHAGAMGLMQLMPATARGLGVTNAYDPYQNIMGGAKYLAQQLKAFGGSIEKALAAYNAGPGNVRKYGGIPPIKETQNYVPKVLSYYQQFGSGTISIANTSKEAAEVLQDIDQAKLELLQLKSDIINVDSTIQQLQVELINSEIEKYEHQIETIDRNIQHYENSLYKLSQTSKEYRDILAKQREHLLNKQKVNEQEINYIRELINSGKLSAIAVAELNDRLNDLLQRRYEIAKQREETTFRIINSTMEQYSRYIDDLRHKLDLSKKSIIAFEEGTEEYNKELQFQLRLQKQIKKQLEDYHTTLKRLVGTENLTIEQKRELGNVIKQLESEIADLSNEMRKLNESIADDIINTIKNVHQKQKEFALEAIDKEMEELEKAHKEKAKMYDEDLNNFEEAVRRKIQLIERQAEEEDYNKQLDKLTQEQLKIQKRISILSIDDSKEAQAKRIELEKELKNITEQIEELKINRERELRRENLEDELEQYRKEIQEKKEVENQKYEIEKERLDKIKRETEYHYDNLINDEQRYAEIRKNIIEGNVEEIKGILQTFYDDMKLKNEQIIKEMGESWAELTNLMNDITMGIGQLQNIQDTEMVLAWQKYIENKKTYDTTTSYDTKQKVKQENEELRKKYGFIDAPYEKLLDIQFTNKDELRQIAWKEYLNNKRLYDLQKTKESKEKLRKENEVLREFWGFPDGSYEQLKNLKVYHEGGIVGESNNFLTRTFRKLMDLKPNEQIVKALKGELMIPPLKISNFINNIQALSPTLTSPNGNVANYYLTIHIDKLSGTKQDAENLSTTIIDNLKKWGKY